MLFSFYIENKQNRWLRKEVSACNHTKNRHTVSSNLSEWRYYWECQIAIDFCVIISMWQWKETAVECYYFICLTILVFLVKQILVWIEISSVF